MVMALENDLEEVSAELRRVQPGGNLDMRALDENVLPTLRTAKSGNQYIFSKRALERAGKVASVMYDNEGTFSSVIRLEEFRDVVLQAITEDYDSANSASLPGQQILSVQRLRSQIGSDVAAIGKQTFIL